MGSGSISIQAAPPVQAVRNHRSATSTDRANTLLGSAFALISKCPLAETKLSRFRPPYSEPRSVDKCQQPMYSLLMARPRHHDKHIERSICYAESLGWRVEMSKGHPWGKMYCPECSRDGCIVVVKCTPRNPENHARQICREVDLCPHIEVSGPDNDE